MKRKRMRRNSNKMKFKKYIEFEKDENVVLAIIYVHGNHPPATERDVVEVSESLEISIGDEFEINEDSEVTVKKEKRKKSWFGF